MPNISKIKKNNLVATKAPKKKSKKTTKKLSLPTPLKTKSKKPSPIDYYNCLLTKAQTSWYDPVTGKKQKITACCKDCKQNAPALNNLREKELVKLITSYKQVGDSLTKLLQPIK